MITMNKYLQLFAYRLVGIINVEISDRVSVVNGEL